VKPSHASDNVVGQNWTQDDEILGAPDWLKAERWDILVEAPTPGPPFPRLRALLEERFKLRRSYFQQAPDRLTARATMFGILVMTLAWAAHGRVIDHTGLTGTYDIDLHWAVDAPNDGNAQPASTT